jgi:HSP20 family protein
MLMRFDPFRELDPLSQLLGRQQGANRQLSMPMDAYRSGDRFIVHFDLPGVDPETIELTTEKNVLTVRAERKWEAGDEVIVSERPQGVFTRQLFLGDGLDTDHIEAHDDNGVLTLTIPVAESAKPKRLTVAHSDGDKRVPAGAASAN